VAVVPASAQTPLVINTTNGPDSSWMGKDVPSVALGKKKFNLRRKLYQNLITRFNAYYNAHTKLERVVEKATSGHQNNYDSLLTLFPYSPEDFQGMRTNLDSVIYDASYGIEVHDPRSKWIDNLYLIAGEAYLYKQDFFNAIAAFKFIIKQKGPTDKEGEPGVIGTRGYTPQQQISVATPETKKLFYHVPSRNDAFIWLVRSYIDSGSYDLARNLISTLKADPVFPARLHTDLLTMEAWFYFRQGLVAKGIPFLEQAIDSVPDKRTRARWQFLLGQYYQGASQWTLAQQHFEQVTRLPADPMMHFYAYLNMTEMHILERKEDFANGSEPLLAMARKDKYERYRSIIYYNLGRMALKSSLRDEAITYFRKSLRYNRDNAAQTLLTTRLLADTYYATGRYREAKQYYDSTAMAMDPSAADYPTVTLRADALGEVVTQLDVITRQDSLQRLAAMPRDELMGLLEQIVADTARARRKRNLILREPAERETAVTGAGISQSSQSTPGSSPKDWYFYNNALKAKGFTLFRSEWGKRPLQDNWRIVTGSGAKAAAGGQAAARDSAAGRTAHQTSGGALTVEDLLAAIPLTPRQQSESGDSVREALFREATTFYDRLSDDSVSLRLLLELETRFPGNPHEDEIAYRLSLIYAHLNNPGRAAFYRQQLTQKFTTSKFTQALYGHPKDTAAPMERLIAGIYDSAYLAYLGGSYDRVLQLKDSATRIYPANTQKARFDLLGAMVLLKQQSDSAGKIALQQITDQDASDTAISQQARAILNALNHKQELVEHLAHLQLPESEEPAAAVQPPPAAAPRPRATTPRDTAAATRPPTATAPATAAVSRPAADTVHAAPPPPPPPRTPYKLSPDEPHFVVMAFNRTDKRLIDESLNRFSAYNQKNHLSQGIEVSSYLLGHNQVVLIFRLFPDEAASLKYYQEIAARAPVSVIPDIPRDYYRFFIISRDNFILLNNTKDYQGYLEFFSKNYR
jgi:tetratricopeptide (TPR) repeat protein